MFLRAVLAVEHFLQIPNMERYSKIACNMHTRTHAPNHSICIHKYVRGEHVYIHNASSYTSYTSRHMSSAAFPAPTRTLAI